jgi:hypothetical protein
MLVMGWFVFGVVFNLRRGDAMLRWMQAGLPQVGPKTTFRWLGTSVAELVIERAQGALRRLETLLVMAPRDVPWVWLAARSQGRQDTLIFRAQPLKAPPVELELANPKVWTGRMALQEASRQGWEMMPAGEMQLMAPRGRLDQAAEIVKTLDPAARRLAPVYWRLSLRKDPARLEIHLPFPDRSRVDARVFFQALQDLAREASNSKTG